jgi:hypothetical protein
MTDRRTELDELLETIRAYDVVEDAWLAKSFTDRLVIVDVEQGKSLPEDLDALLTSHDVYGYNDVYDTQEANASFAGDARDSTRHQFVDVRTTGDHQSYVIE